MDFNNELSKNLMLVSSETAYTYKNGAVYQVRFFFLFYGQEFSAEFDKQRVANDRNSIDAEGDSELFDSFVDQVENKYWEQMKEYFRQHEKYENDLNDIGADDDPVATTVQETDAIVIDDVDDFIEPERLFGAAVDTFDIKPGT